MKTIKHNELEYVLEKHAENNKNVAILGRTGIGKSETVKKVAKKIAEKQGKQFIEWNNTSIQKKRELLNEPDKYYIFTDIRLSQISPEDLRGLPFIVGESVEWKNNLWAMALHNCAGYLFFDEFNLAMPSIQAATYQILLDRQIGEIPLHKDVSIALAGNVVEDNAGTYEIPKPVRTRVSLYQLSVPSADEWIEWGYNNGIDSRILTYLQVNKSKIFLEMEDDVISPRGWKNVSDLIRGVDSLKEVELLSSGVIGQGVAVEFTSFLKLKDDIPLPIDVLNGRAKVPEDISLKYMLTTEIVELYKQDKQKKDILDKIFKLQDKFDSVEVFVWLLRLTKRIDEDKFKMFIGTNTEARNIITTKLSKYLL